MPGRRGAGCALGCLTTLVLLAALGVAADRIAVALAEQAAARRVATALDARQVGVDIDGFPFLTQAARRQYDRVDVRAAEVGAGAVRLTQVEATLLDVRPTRDLRSAAVGRLSGTGLVSYDGLTDAVGREGVRVAFGGEGQVAVRGEIEVLGRDVGVTAYGRVAATAGNRISVRAVRLETGLDLLDDVLTRAVGDRLDLDVPVTGLPDGVRLDRVAATPQGVRAHLSGEDLTLQAP